MNKPAIAGLICLAVLGIFYLACVHYLEPNQVGIVRNRFTGEVRLDDQASFDITPPWIAVSRIDIRPMRVCITSASRGFNCKLIQFAPAHFKEFVLVQGFHYYWWANRISFNFGYNEEYRGMKDLLRGYAYGTKQYPFVKILRDYKEEE